jgi:hypothetical protein
MSQNRYTDVRQMVKYEWIEDDFKANYLTLGVCLTKLNYHVKK